MSVGQDNGAEGMVLEGNTRLIEGVDMRVAHIFKFSKAQGLFGDSSADDGLFCQGQVVREEGDKLHCQVGSGAEGFCA